MNQPSMTTRELLAALGWSVADLAKALEISRAAVYLWNDKIPPLRWYQICELPEYRALSQSPVESTQEPQEPQEPQAA